jgi:hypothetical protein
MNANELILQADTHVQTLNELLAQYNHTVEQDRLNLDLTDRPAKLAARKQQVRDRLAPVLEFRKQANEVLAEVAPVAEPDRTTDPLTLYRREHELFAMKPEQRVAAFNDAIRSSDRLTYDVVCVAGRERPWLNLVPAKAVAWGMERWADRHHPSPTIYTHLCDAISRVEAAFARVENVLAEGR